MSKSSKLITSGSRLAEALSLPVAEGHFHRDGTFYARPNSYPCAFFDQRGYIIVDSEAVLTKLADVSDKVNFGRPISKQAKYIIGDNWQDWPRLAQERQDQKSNVAQAKKLFAQLNEDERRKLIDKLR